MAGDSKHIVVVGAGITGLAAAWELTRTGPGIEVTVCDGAPRPGGVLQSEKIGEYLVEHSADMFSCEPEGAIELCRQLGIDGELLCTHEVQDKAFVGFGDQIAAVPKGFSLMVPALEGPIRDWPFLSAEGKQRLLDEVNIRPRASDGQDDEDFRSFAVRRFGLEAFEKLIQPLVSGIYTADPKRLSMRATLGRFLDMEREHGSLIGAMQASRGAGGDASASGARYGLFRGPAGGFGELVSALHDRLATTCCFRLETAIESVARSGDRWCVVPMATGQVPIECDGVILATPARVAGGLLGGTEFGELTSELGGIEAASSAIVTMGIARADLQLDFSGFGIIYPHVDGGQVIAISFASNKFTGRAPEGKLLLRVFIGGALQGELVDLSDEELVKIAIGQLDRSLGYEGTPEFTRVVRWKDSMPQYHLGHVAKVDRIEGLVGEVDGLELAGKSYRGVGIPACVQSGVAAAQRVMAW